MGRLYTRAPGRDLIWIETPFGEPEPKIVVAASRAGAFGILDLGTDAAAARAALDLVGKRIGSERPFGVRVTERSGLGSSELPPSVDTVVLADHSLLPGWLTTTDRKSVV